MWNGGLVLYDLHAHRNARAVRLICSWRSITGSYALRPIDADAIGLAAMNVLFFLILIAFGIKAGVMPPHFWLPSDHANAPSHVSAIMSGVVIKMGIYVLVRFLFLLPEPSVIGAGQSSS